jgi:hypothetical protein
VPPVTSNPDPQQQQLNNIHSILDQTATVPAKQTPATNGTAAPTPPAPTAVKPSAPSPLGAKALSSNMDTQKRAELDLMTHLTQRSNRVFLSAQTKAKELEDQFIDSEHLLHGLLADGEIYKLLTELKVQPQLVEQELTPLYKRESNKLLPPQNSPRLNRCTGSFKIGTEKRRFK